MNFMKDVLNIYLNEYWQPIYTTYDSIWNDLHTFSANNKGGTLLVCPIISYAKQQYCFLVVAIDRPKRIIFCTTTLGEFMDKQLCDYLCNLKDNGHFFAVVPLRLKCEQNHETFVVYLGDIFSNGKFNPLHRMLSDSQILQQYNIHGLAQQWQSNNHQHRSNNHHHQSNSPMNKQQQLDEKVREWNEMNRLIANTHHPGLRNQPRNSLK